MMDALSICAMHSKNAQQECTARMHSKNAQQEYVCTGTVRNWRWDSPTKKKYQNKK